MNDVQIREAERQEDPEAWLHDARRAGRRVWTKAFEFVHPPPRNRWEQVRVHQLADLERLTIEEHQRRCKRSNWTLTLRWAARDYRIFLDRGSSPTSYDVVERRLAETGHKTGWALPRRWLEIVAEVMATWEAPL